MTSLKSTMETPNTNEDEKRCGDKSRSTALLAALDDIAWRINDVSEMLRETGVGGTRLYGCDEWSTPVVNLRTAKLVVNNLRDKILAEFAPDWDRVEAAHESLREHMILLSRANTLLTQLRDTKETWVGSEEESLRIEIDRYLRGDYGS